CAAVPDQDWRAEGAISFTGKLDGAAVDINDQVSLAVSVDITGSQRGSQVAGSGWQEGPVSSSQQYSSTGETVQCQVRFAVAVEVGDYQRRGTGGSGCTDGRLKCSIAIPPEDDDSGWESDSKVGLSISVEVPRCQCRTAIAEVQELWRCECPI